MRYLYVAIFTLIFEINGNSVSALLLFASIPMFFLKNIIKPVKYKLYELLPILVILSIWSIYLVFNNFINGHSLYIGVLWWFVIIVFIFIGPEKNIVNEVKILFYCVSTCLFLDLVYRFSFVTLSDIGTNYYLIKKNSILGVDSNVSGIYGLLCLSVLLSANKFLVKKFLLVSIITMLILIVLTFSKAAIFSSVVLLAYAYLPRKLFACVLVLIIAFGLMFSLNNESGLSKFELYELSKSLLSELESKQLLLGLGLGNVLFSTNGLTPHILFLQIILYLGFIGFIMYISLWFSLFMIVGKPLMYLFIPYLLVSLSFTPIGFPLLSFAILFFIRYRKELV